MEAEQVVASLFRHHLGLSDSADEIRSFRDLFRLPTLAMNAQKARLIAAAERTSCADVIMDVLLFVSQTIAKDAFYAQLSRAPTCQQHWIQYELSQQQQTAHGYDAASADARRIAVEARVASILATLVATKTPPQDVAVVLLQLIFREEQGLSLVATQAIAREVLRVVTRIKPYRLPQWTIDLLQEFVELSDLQLETERRDSFKAPPPQTLSAYFDKRARGANNVNANWRMRSFQLDETQISYSKHDAEKLATSRNPFLDKRVKGTVKLTKHLPVEPLNYVGKVSRRPYCIKIGHGDDALIIDVCTPVVQQDWLTAIAGNVRRLELDPRWVRFPRPNVLGMSLHAFAMYAAIYHSDSGNASSSSEYCDTQQLATKFQLNDKRLLFLTLLALARLGDWSQFEAVAFTTSKPKMFSKSTTINPGTAIGYGAVLDIAVRHGAPISLIAKIESLYDKNDVKKPVWTCHTKTSGDGVSIDVHSTESRHSMTRSPAASSTISAF